MMQQPGAAQQQQQYTVPYQQPQQQQMWGHQQPTPSHQSDEVRTLWIGDLQYWMDESYLHNCFSLTGEFVNVKVIRNKQTNQVEGYGFIEFVSHAAAERILQTYNGTPMPNAQQNFRLNWASHSGGEKREDTPDFTIFVGDLAADVTDHLLQETFGAHYASVKSAKVMMDKNSGRSKGYGFVHFGDENEQLRAVQEMNGAFCSTRQMRIGLANKKSGSGQQYPRAFNQNSQTQNDDDPNNTTVFVGNLESNVTEDHLRALFSQCGQLVHVKIPAGKRCGFVKFAERSCAEQALHSLNGVELGGQSIRLSWGRSPSHNQPQPNANQWNAGYYGYGQGQVYENYGYAAPPQDPNVYHGGYTGYGGYQQQQNQAGYS